MVITVCVVCFRLFDNLTQLIDFLQRGNHLAVSAQVSTVFGLVCNEVLLHSLAHSCIYTSKSSHFTSRQLYYHNSLAYVVNAMSSAEIIILFGLMVIAIMM